MDLKELLGEELFTQVESKLGDKKLGVVNDGSWLPKSKLDEKLAVIKTLEEETQNYVKQLDELKASAKGNEELTAKIGELQELNDKTRAEYEEKVKATQLEAALKLALNNKVHDFGIVNQLIDKTTIQLDDNGNVLNGLEEQINKLQQEKAFLFQQELQDSTGLEKDPKPTAKMSVGNHNGESKIEDDAFAIALRKRGYA